MVESAIEHQTNCLKPFPSTAAHVDIWSTDTTGARERLSYWQDAVCRAVFGISIEATPERFSARIAARNCGALRFAISESTTYRIARSRHDIARAADDHYSIYLQLGGRTVITRDGEDYALDANDLAIYDGRQPFQALHGGRRAIAVLPRAMVEARAPWLRQRASHKLPTSSPYVDLARRHLLQLTNTDSAPSESATRLLTENLCNLVALATGSEISLDRAQPELQTEALLAYCRQHLHDPELSPTRAADHLGISIRTLHSRFNQIGQTFGRWVLDHRLEACALALRDPGQNVSNISEIAYRWGFNDLSYFNKAFRARFDMTPGEWRRELQIAKNGSDESALPIGAEGREWLGFEPRERQSELPA
jgi:AraC family transcriptional activator of tynA and feaB